MSFGASFLACPDLFPGRRAGETWGDRSAVVRFAGARYRFSGLSGEQQRLIEERFGSPGPAAGDAADAVETSVYRAPESDFVRPDTSGWHYALDLDPRPGSLRVAGLELMGVVTRKPRLGGGLWTSRATGEAFAGVVENFFRVLVAYRLVEAGGVLLHSAAVVAAGGACVFFGPSGAGKTTVASLGAAGGRAVLSDDLNALVPADGGPRVAQLPFAGDFGRARRQPGSFPLVHLCRLVQGDEHALRPLAPGRALAALTACCPFVNADPYRRDRLLAALAGIVESRGAEELTFRPDPGLWQLLEGRAGG